MRIFFIIWAGQVVSLLGTGMTRFALLIWAWQSTGEATALALVGFFAFGPYVLVSPIAGDAAEIALGQERFEQFCTPCHGPGGRGDGPVVGPNRIPPIPALDLTTDGAVGYTDGYIWGMISNGRGLMPSYHRIPVDERWRIVAYVRQLQRQAAEGGAAAGARAAGDAAGGAEDTTAAGGQP